VSADNNNNNNNNNMLAYKAPVCQKTSEAPANCKGDFEAGCFASSLTPTLNKINEGGDFPSTKKLFA